MEEQQAERAESDGGAARATRPPRRPALHRDANVTPKEKLQKVLTQMDGPSKLVAKVLEAEVEGVTVRDVLASGKEVRNQFFLKKIWNYDSKID